MHRLRFLLVAVCTLALAFVASATTPNETPSSGGVCTKLCAIGFHCVPTPNGGVCEPDHGLAEPAPADSTECTETSEPTQTIASASFCNKLCAIGLRCVPTPSGGVCVPDNGLAEPAPADSTEPAPSTSSDCGADTGVGALVASNGASGCGACTILCPYPTHLVQTGNCQCKCVGSAG
jgi:hypothetical protein